MSDDFGRHFADVVWQDVRPPAHEGQRPAGGDKVDRCARAGSIGDRRGEVFEALDFSRTAGIGECGGVGPDGRVDVDLADGLLHFLELVERDHLVELDLGSRDAFDHDHFFLEGRIVDEHL